MADELIAISAATGGMGGRVAARLAAAGAHQRLVVRDAARAPELPGAEIGGVPGGYGDRNAYREALQGASTFFLVPAHEAIGRVELHGGAIDAAVHAGVERIVYLSFVNTRPDGTFTFGRDHFATEQLVRATGVPFTFVRMSWYMDFLPSMAGTDGVIRGPAGDGRVGAVLRDDLADVVSVTLTSGGHEGATYEVTGPEAFTLAEAAAALGVGFEDETEEEAYASRASYGAPDWEVEGWVTSYLAMKNGELDLVTDVVRRLAGHEPTSLGEFVTFLSPPR